MVVDTYAASDWNSSGRAWPALFAAIDASDARRFAAFIVVDGEFRFGNLPAVQGRAAIEAAVAAFFRSIHACRHALLRSWVVGEDVIAEGEVTYTRLDGGRVVLPFANCFTLRDGAIASYRIYIDNTPLYSP